MIRRTIVRPATSADLDAADALERAHFHVHSISRRQLRYLQRRKSVIFLVAEQGGEIVGDGIALVRRHRRGRSGRIYSLVVRTESRGQKIGQKLLVAMIDRLAARGVARIYLEVEQSNVGAVRLYEQSGFRPVGQVPGYYGRGKHALRMMRELSDPGAKAGKVRPSPGAG